MYFYLFVIINSLVRRNNLFFQKKEINNDAALIPFEDLPKNEFYNNFTSTNNYRKKYRGIIYPPK